MGNTNITEFTEKKMHVIIYQTSRMKFPLIAVSKNRIDAKLEIKEKRKLREIALKQ
jgi:hypothetical protein